MLTAFHQAALIQATVAHEVANNHRSTPVAIQQVSAA
jgi:hypothetical protein